MRVNVNANGHVYGQVSVDEPEDKTAIYHEPFNMNMYSGLTPGRKKALEGVLPLKGPPELPEYTGRTHIIY